ncbi:MAG: hypothetical protein V4549_07510 [Bacteroidota bacterium]
MYNKDLKPFYESTTIKPLLHDHTVQTVKLAKKGEKKEKNSTYRVERWFSSTEGVRKIGCQRKKLLTKDDFEVLPERTHCYIFIDITMDTNERKNPFAKKPSVVADLLKNKKIIITNCPWKT